MSIPRLDDSHPALTRSAAEREETALHVLFVCTGNICRSPTAERLTVTYAAEREISGVAVSSAGTRALIGHPIHPEAALVLESLGADGSKFAARQINERIAADADLVLTMTRAHRDTVLEHAPHRLRRTFTLAEAARLVSDCGAQTVDELATLRRSITADESFDISDPIGRSAEFFAAVASRIAECLMPILDLCQSQS